MLETKLQTICIILPFLSLFFFVKIKELDSNCRFPSPQTRKEQMASIRGTISPFLLSETYVKKKSVNPQGLPDEMTGGGALREIPT